MMQKLPTIFKETLRSAWRVILAVSWTTFREILADRIYWMVVLFAGILFGVGILASQLNILNPQRVILDIGLSAVSICSSVVAVLLGSSLMIKEFERKTIQLAYSRPIDAYQFFVGKFGGLKLILVMNWLLLVGTFFFILWVMSDSTALFWSALSGAVVFGLVLGYLQALFVGALAMLFSLFSTTSVAVMFSVGFYLLGSNHGQLGALVTGLEGSWLRGVLKSLLLLLPNFEVFQIGTQAVYGIPLNLGFVLNALVYGILGTWFLLICGSYRAQKRQIG